MGTFYEALISGGDEAYARQAAQAAFREVDHLESLFSRFNPASEIGQINRLGPGAVLKIGWETYDCLAVAERVRIETDGAFNINFRAEKARQERGSGAQAEGGAGPRPAFKVFPSTDGFAVRINHRPFEDHGHGVDLDLGGIGKGFALDRAATVLADWSVDHFLIHAGTSTALAAGSAAGAPPDEPGWPVGVGGVGDLPGLDKRARLLNRAISGSGTEVKGPHIKDPGTGAAGRRAPCGLGVAPPGSHRRRPVHGLHGDADRSTSSATAWSITTSGRSSSLPTAKDASSTPISSRPD